MREFIIVVYWLLGVWILKTYIEVRLLWLYESKLELIKIINNFVESEANIIHEEVLKEAKKEKIDIKAGDATLKRVQSVYFIRIYESLQVKKTFSVLVNPFSKSLGGIVKNKKLLNYIISNQTPLKKWV